MPSWATLKLAAYGLIGLALLGAVIFAVQTINGWRHDSLALPAVTAERDQALAQKAELEKYAVGAFTHIESGIVGLDRKWAAFETNYIGRMSSIDDAIAAFGRNTDHVEACPLPGSPGDQLIRGELFRLLANPDTGSIERGADGAGAGGTGAAMPGAAAPAPALPGRPAAAEDQQGVVVPATGSARRGHRRKAAQGRNRRSDRLGAKGAVQAAGAGGVGPSVSCSVRVTCGVKHRKAAKRFAKALSEALDHPVPVHVYG